MVLLKQYITVRKVLQLIIGVFQIWAKDRGDKGYGWLPYDYVLNNLALDFWSLLSMEWMDSKQFGI
jgi:C1A family cysteine protease